jgi:hypothetical protein
MYIADVGRLPWPHGLFRCANKHIFEAALPDADKDRSESCQVYVEATARSLSESQIRLCPYHRPDWNLAARVAIDGWRDCESDDPSDVADALNQANLADETLWAAESFFIEPIWIIGPSLGNGQHRVCAMKLAGVRQCLVEE